MVTIILDKTYLTIEELAKRWALSVEDVQYLTENGFINVYVRPIALEAAFVPLFSYISIEQIKKTPLRPVDVHRVFRADDSGVSVSQFQGKLIEKPITVALADLVILMTDIVKYEAAHTQQPQDFKLITPDYREFIIRGQVMRMGTKQATVVKYLHERAQTDNPWVHGKELMKIAGSESWKIQNLFGRHKNWRMAILSDGRGYYRFNGQG